MRLRSEAEAPWRSLRLTLFGFSVASAGMGTLISLPQLIGALGGAPGALAVETVLQNLAVNLGAVGIFSFLFSRDWKVCVGVVGGGGVGECVCGWVEGFEMKGVKKSADVALLFSCWALAAAQWLDRLSVCAPPHLCDTDTDV